MTKCTCQKTELRQNSSSVIKRVRMSSTTLLIRGLAFYMTVTFRSDGATHDRIIGDEDQKAS